MSIIHNMSNDSYHAHENWSNTNFSHVFELSPYHAYYHKYTEKREPTPAQEKGIAIHACILEHERYLKDFVVFKGRRAGKKWEEFLEEHGDKNVITADLHDICMMTRESVMAHSLARSLIEDQRFVEPSAFADLYGLPCKSRPDIVTRNDWLVDLKSTQIARPDQFSKSIENYNYDRQGAFHHDCWVKASGGYVDATRLPYIWIAVESSAPFGVSVLQMIPEMLLYGRKAYQQLIEVIQNCIDQNTWPCYGDPWEMFDASYPPWSKRGDLAYE